MTEDVETGRVQEAMKRVLFKPSEMIMSHGELPDDALLVKGVVSMYGFHPERLEAERAEVVGLIEEIVSDKFLIDGGGGGSFLELCYDREGNQWTSFHREVEAFMCLAMGLGLAGFCAPYEMWEAFPGGMPYVWFRRSLDVCAEVFGPDGLPLVHPDREAN